jgi:arylsulfatase A-like enzyme
MITSTYPFDYGEYLEFTTPARLSRKRVLLSEVLKRRGYSTAFFHDNPYLSPVFGYNRGFDRAVDFGAPARGEHPQREIRKLVFSTFKNEKVRRMFWRTKDYLSFLGWYLWDVSLQVNAETLLARAYRWIKTADSPYFLWLHFMDTHIPYSPRHDILEKFKINKFNAFHVISKHFAKKPLTTREAALFEVLYDAQIYRIDQALAEYLPRILNEKVEETYVFVTADHGEEFSDKRKIGHHVSMLADELLHVPLVIHGGELEAEVKDMRASLIDLAPTVLDLLRVRKPQSFKGTSLLKGKPSPLIAQGIRKGKRHQRML